MPLENGITVEQAIAQLQKLDPKAVLAFHTGEYGIITITQMKSGVLYRSSKKDEYYSGLDFVPSDQVKELSPKFRQRQAAVLLD